MKINTINDLPRDDADVAINHAVMPYNNNKSWVEMLFPELRFVSITTLIGFIMFVMFIADNLIMRLLLASRDNFFRHINYSNGPAIYNKEVWRLITPAFFHLNATHLFVNLIVILRYGSLIESLYGSLYYVLIFLFTTTYANLFSVTVQPCKNAAGASTFGYALFSMKIMLTIYIWRHLTSRSSAIRNILFTLILILFLNFLSGSIDWAGHLGGSLAAIMLYCIFPRTNGLPIIKHANKIKIVAATLLLVSTLTLVLMFAFDPTKLRSHC